MPRPPEEPKRFTVSLFRNKRDNDPRHQAWTWDDLVLRLGRHHERADKDGALWSPTRFAGGRNADAAAEICALVLDFDAGHDWADFQAYWARWAHLVYTTHSHTDAHPKWRAVFPFLTPAPADGENRELWHAIHRVLCDELGGGVASTGSANLVDPLRDTARMYYLPSRPPDVVPYAAANQGDWLDWRKFVGLAQELLRIEEEATRTGRDRRVPPAPSPGTGRPGDDFNARAEWADILEPQGWSRQGRYGLMTLWTRPGKNPRKGCSARTGPGIIGDRMVNWSTSVAELPVNRAFDKFGVYARLVHGGDLSVTARDLATKGYGAPPLGIPATSPPPPPKPDPAPAKQSDSTEPPASVESQLEMIETPAGEMEPEAIDAAFGDYLPWTDLGNARRLLRCYDGQIRYCADWGRWLLWEGSRWHEDAPENPGIRRYAHELADALFARKRTRDLGKKLQGGRNISSMLREAQALPGVNVRYDDLDTHEMLLAAPNGVIDLRTGRLLDPDPDLLITKGTDVPYDPTAKCPTFERFLVEIMKERRELVELLLRALGYSLTGSTKEQKFFLLYGERGRNGKSTLMDLMQDLLGYGLAYTIKKKLLTDSDADSARFSKAVIEGKRMVYADEAKKGSRFDTEFVKEFVGGKRMEAERKGKDAYQFKVHAKLWYAVNSLPSADFDSSFQDRLVPIPFEQSYYPPDSDLWREGDKDPDYDLPEKLLRELPGILALLVKGCLRWQEHGGLGLPEQVTALKRRYEADNDHVATWIAERCHKSEFARAKGTDLFQSYRDFAKGLGVRSIGRIGDFNARLEKEKGVRQIKPGNVSTFTGIELRLDQGALGDDE